jgi:predicted membrane-bound spermidine synthase
MTTVIKRMTFNKKFVVKIIYGRSIDATRVTIFTARARQWFKLTSFNNFEISIWELVFNDPVFFMTISFLYA